MDRIDAMRVFVEVVERGSFSAAARELSLPRSSVTEAIQQIEARLGVRLMHRTTRSVTPTAEGDDYYRSCVGLLQAFDDAEATVGSGGPVGTLRVRVDGPVLRSLIVAELPTFLSRHPRLRIRFEDSGVAVPDTTGMADCTLSLEAVGDAAHRTRTLALLARVTCATAGYLKEHGEPADPDGLDGHLMVGFGKPGGTSPEPLEFSSPEGSRRMLLSARVEVATPESRLALVRQGVGLGQFLRDEVERDLSTGSLVEVLGPFAPPPLELRARTSADRELPLRVTVFLDWLADLLSGSGSSPE